MKKLLILFLFPFSLTAQEVLNEYSSAVKIDTNYYLVTTVVTDNGTDYPDTVTSKTYLGDSITAITNLVSTVENYNNYLHRIYDKLFEVMGQSELAKLNQAYTTIVGENIYQGLADRLNYQFEGTYRVFDGATNYIATATANANGIIRLVQDDDPTNNLVLRPLSRNSFLITNYSEGPVYLYEKTGVFNDQRRLYLSEKRAVRDNTLRIVFIKGKDIEGF